jgi:hypothetical protein
LALAQSEKKESTHDMKGKAASFLARPRSQGGDAANARCSLPQAASGSSATLTPKFLHYAHYCADQQGHRQTSCHHW